MENERVVARNISMYPNDWAVVHQVAKNSGQRSVSGGLRALIADYVKLKAQMSGIELLTDTGERGISQEM